MGSIAATRRNSPTAAITLAAAVTAVTITCAPASTRADFTWTGLDAGDLWSVGANWMGGTAPPLDLAGDNFIFGPTGGAQSPDAGADDYINISALSFTGADASLNLIGSGSLTFQDAATITNDSLFAQMIDIDIIGSEGELIVDASTGNLVFGGGFDLRDGDGVMLTIRGAADTTITGIIRGGDSNLVKEGTGELYLDGENSYGGGTELVAGTLVLGANKALGTGDLEVTGDSTIESDGNGRKLGNGVSIDDTVTLTYGGARDLELSGVISGDGEIEINTDADSVKLTLNGNNTYTGGTTLTRGRISLGNDAALGTGRLKVAGDGSLRSTVDGRSISNRIRIDNAVGLTVVGGADLSLTGKILGAGMLGYRAAKSRDTLTLSGDNSYSGGTMLEKGTVIVGHNRAFGTGAITMLGNGIIESTDDKRRVRNDINLGNKLLIADGDFDLELSGDISGTGRIRIDDNATLRLTLSGSNTYTGDTDVEGGELLLKGSVGGRVNVSGGGTLSGSGTIAGDLINRNNGIVSPGTGIGTLVVGGDYDQRDNSTLVVKIGADNGRSDLLDVSGVATLARKSTILASITSDGYITAGDKFTIIDADGGVTDNGAKIKTDSATLTVRLLLDDDFNDGDNTYALMVDRAADAYEDAASGRNNEAIGATLDSLVEVADAAPNGGVADLLSDLDAKAVPGYNRALVELSPLSYDAGPRLAFDSAQAFTSTQATHLAAKRSGIESWSRFMRNTAPRTGAGGAGRSGISPGSLAYAGHDQALLIAALAEMQDDRPISVSRASDDRFGTYAKFESVFSRLDSTPGRTGYNTDSIGGQFGIDYRVTQGFTAGFAFGYATADSDLLEGQGQFDADSIRFGPYFSLASGTWYLDGSVSAALHSYDTQRDIPSLGRTALSDYDADEYSGYLAMGQRHSLGGNLYVTPSVSVQYSMLEVDGFRERDAGAANLVVQGRDSESLRGRVGANLAWHLDLGVKLLPGIYFGYEREFLDDETIQAAFAVGGDPFVISAGDRPEDNIIFGLSLPMLFDPKFSAFLRYEQIISGDGNIHTLAGGVSLTF